MNLEKTVIKKKLERDLPFPLDVCIGEGRYTGTQVNARWAVRDKDGDDRVMLRAVLGVPDRVGQRAVIQDVLLDSSLHGLSIGRVFARNALGLLENAGGAAVDLATSSNGAYFWQKIGFLAGLEGDVVEDVLADGDIPQVIPFAQMCASIQSRLTAYAAWGLVSEKKANRILAALDPHDPSSMGAALDRDVKMPHLHAVVGRELYSARDEGILPPTPVIRKKLEKGKLEKLFATLGLQDGDVKPDHKVSLMQQALRKTAIVARFDFTSAPQRARLEKATSGACVNVKKLQKRLNRLGLAL